VGERREMQEYIGEINTVVTMLHRWLYGRGVKGGGRGGEGEEGKRREEGRKGRGEKEGMKELPSLSFL